MSNYYAVTIEIGFGEYEKDVLHAVRADNSEDAVW